MRAPTPGGQGGGAAPRAAAANPVITDPARTDADAFHKAKEALDQLSMRLHETSIARSLQSMSKPGGAGDTPTTG